MDSGGTVNYATDGSDVASPVLADTNATFTPGLSERRGTTSKFYHTDALGSTRGISNSSQSATDGILYDAFGMTLSRTGTTPTPFGFVGAGQYQTDPDSGLMLLGHRYYDPSTGRFITSDPAQAGDNWYAYCDNNPTVGTDPQGLDVKIVGPPEYRKRMRKLIDRVRKTKTGKKALAPYDGGKTLIVAPGPTPRTMPPDPHGGPDLITFPDPIKKMPPYESGSPGHPRPAPWDPGRGFGHELGHLYILNPTPDKVSLPVENEIIRRYENPIGHELNPKSRPRTHYDPY